MTGEEEGIFNLKFVSKDDGRYEAVYDRKGNLVTENTRSGDNIGYRNMGTYNYASPSKKGDQKGDHTMYDIIPFYMYGNIRGTNRGMSTENDIAFKCKDKFLESKEAIEHYNGIADKFDIDLVEYKGKK
ncbi:hypothetical protein [Peptoclostridium litorale]|nr:hypothetical protein [Peptoclostridium litorale]